MESASHHPPRSSKIKLPWHLRLLLFCVVKPIRAIYFCFFIIYYHLFLKGQVLYVPPEYANSDASRPPTRLLSKFSQLPLKQPRTVRLVCISDTHDTLPWLTLPQGDILLHAGDVTFKGEGGEAIVKRSVRAINSIECTHKFVVGGNHDWPISDVGADSAQEKLFGDSCQYLEESGSSILLSDVCQDPPGFERRAVSMRQLTIHGSPSTPEGRSQNRAFQVPRTHLQQLVDMWRESIPQNVDILLTHEPPLQGCLVRRISEEKNPRVHVCGHVHGAYGVFYLPSTARGSGNGNRRTLVVLAALMSRGWLYVPGNPPIVVDMPIEEESPVLHDMVGEILRND